MSATPATAASEAGPCTSKPAPARPLGRASPAELGPKPGPTASVPTLPRPVASESMPVPADHGLGPYHVHRIPPTRPQPREKNPEDPVHLRQPRPWLARLPHGELLPQRQVLQRQLAVRANRASQCPKEDPEPSDLDRRNSRSVRRMQINRGGSITKECSACVASPRILPYGSIASRSKDTIFSVIPRLSPLRCGRLDETLPSSSIAYGMDELQGHDRLLDEFSHTFDFLQIALKYGYMIQRLVRSIRPKIACAEADIVSWLYLSLHVVSGCVGKRGWCRDVHDRARLSANVTGYPNVTGNKLVLDAHCLADCKGLRSKRKSAGSQRTRQWELSIDQRLEFLSCCDSLLYNRPKPCLPPRSCRPSMIPTFHLFEARNTTHRVLRDNCC